MANICLAYNCLPGPEIRPQWASDKPGLETITILSPCGLCPLMPNDRKPRIAITPDALRALKVWAALEDSDPGDLAARLILTHMPARVRDALRENPPLPSEGCGAMPAIVKRKRLSENPDALEQIRQMWKDGEHNQAEIARRIGYHRATVNDTIKRMREAGELE